MFNFNYFFCIWIRSQLANTKTTTWRRNFCCQPFCCWNLNWRPSFHCSLESLESKPLKHWSSRNWHFPWLLDSLHTTYSRNQPLQLQQWTPPLPLHHHTIQAAGNQVPPAAAHMLVFGIHPHKIWHTALTTRAVHLAQTVAAHHQSQLPQNQPPIQLFKIKGFKLSTVNAY